MKMWASGSRRKSAYNARGVPQRMRHARQAVGNPPRGFSSGFCSLISFFAQVPPLVENGFSHKDDPVPRLVAERYLAPLKEHGIDTLIMGCTHYPILRDIIAQIMGKEVTLIDSGKETASFASEMLRSQNALCDETQTAAYSFFVSDRVEGFSKAASIFLEQNIAQDEQYINIDAFAKDP